MFRLGRKAQTRKEGWRVGEGKGEEAKKDREGGEG